MNEKPLNELALIMLNLTKLTRTQVCIATQLSPQNASHWLNGRVDSFSMDKQKKFLGELGLIVMDRGKLKVRLSPEKLHNWMLDGNVAEIKEVLGISVSPDKLKELRIFRYEGKPSREALLMIPEDSGRIWIRLRLEKSASHPTTIDSSALGLGTNVNLSAQDWFVGINSGENDFEYLKNYFNSVDDDSESDFFIWNGEQETPENKQWLNLLDQILQRGYEFPNVMRKVSVIFDIDTKF